MNLARPSATRKPLWPAPGHPRAVADEPPGNPSFLAMLRAGGLTPGVWLGIAGYVLLVAASLLPWYNVSAQLPGLPAPNAFQDMTTIIQFDGLNGLFVHEQLKSALGFGVPSIGFPFAIFFFISAILKIRKIIRSNQHKMRAATLVRSSIAILVPFAVTLAAIYTIPSYLPASAPAQAQILAHAISSQPFGGSQQFDFPDPANPVATTTGTLQWGFGPALYLMIVAAVLMNLGSQLEMRVYRRVTHELEVEAAEERESAPKE